MGEKRKTARMAFRTLDPVLPQPSSPPYPAQRSATPAVLGTVTAKPGGQHEASLDILRGDQP